MSKLSEKAIGQEYHKHAYDIAVMFSKLKDKRDRFEWLSDQTQDNADPQLDADEVLLKMGYLLSTTVIYANEYCGTDKDSENEKG